MDKFVRGQGVHYVPSVNISEHENGVVKSITENGAGVFVVYHCNDDWDNYENYTAQLTPVEHLKPGWVTK